MPHARKVASVDAVRSFSSDSRLRFERWLSKDDKTAAEAARLFKVHPATVSRLMARASSGKVNLVK
jgi:IS30 family transposase